VRIAAQLPPYLRVEGASFYFVAVLQRVHLVLDERNQRRHHDSQPCQNNTRQLIAQALPGACRHQHKHVLPHDGGIHNFFLLEAVALQFNDLSCAFGIWIGI
jgi:hypothetical protein